MEGNRFIQFRFDDWTDVDVGCQSAELQTDPSLSALSTWYICRTAEVSKIFSSTIKLVKQKTFRNYHFRLENSI